ncbi:YncE family protein [Glaciimonas immobilis]|uniref:YVTN family beta-propeller protein n=1 Tax=Glaciimonas immobilis TaxID=728004 RepID=A0A840RTQ8_9BURK|nr:YncE family protein [Glaciimonas immobilis]KAF3996594.1 YncE family protein [Glaciimonas immobilis]MBB5201033.1 YVTN family beta-propeller protein [Glaciimonas immobilis]
MKNFTLKTMITVTLLPIALLSTVHASTQHQYEIASKYPLSGVEGWDYIALDSKRGHLFISRSDHVQVMDTATGKMVGSIVDTAGVHGVAFAQDLNLGFTSNGKSDTVTVFELDSLKVVDTIKTTGHGPDAILYNPALKRIYTFNGHGQNVTVIDAMTRKVIATIAVAGRPEFAVNDSQGHIFFNIEDKNEMAMIDTQSSTIVKRWSLAPCEEPSGLAIDEAQHRLFAVCSNKKMMVVDAVSGKIVTTVAVGDGPDAVAFDPHSKLIFVSNGSGALTVVHQETPDRYTVKTNLPTQKGAKTLALNPDTHTVYLVGAQFSPAPAVTANAPHPRPSVIADTVNVMVVSPK